MAQEWTAAKMGHKGGKTRAERFSKRQIAEWGKQGGCGKLDANPMFVALLRARPLLWYRVRVRSQ
jgi:hypothetical protein